MTMTHARILRINEVGSDYAIFGNLRCNFKNSDNGTKEEAASFFQPLLGKEAAIEAPEAGFERAEELYIGVDGLHRRDGDNVMTVPMRFAVSSIDVIV
jgi:hypothetical protein